MLFPDREEEHCGTTTVHQVILVLFFYITCQPISGSSITHVMCKVAETKCLHIFIVYGLHVQGSNSFFGFLNKQALSFFGLKLSALSHEYILYI